MLPANRAQHEHVTVRLHALAYVVMISVWGPPVEWCCGVQFSAIPHVRVQLCQAVDASKAQRQAGEGHCPCCSPRHKLQGLCRCCSRSCSSRHRAAWVLGLNNEAADGTNTGVVKRLQVSKTSRRDPVSIIMARKTNPGTLHCCSLEGLQTGDTASGLQQLVQRALIYLPA